MGILLGNFLRCGYVNINLGCLFIFNLCSDSQGGSIFRHNGNTEFHKEEEDMVVEVTLNSKVCVQI